MRSLLSRGQLACLEGGRGCWRGGLHPLDLPHIPSPTTKPLLPSPRSPPQRTPTSCSPQHAHHNTVTTSPQHTSQHSHHNTVTTTHVTTTHSPQLAHHNTLTTSQHTNNKPHSTTSFTCRRKIVMKGSPEVEGECYR